MARDAASTVPSCWENGGYRNSNSFPACIAMNAKLYSDIRLRVNGLRLHYADWGNPHLPDMLLTHGTVANAAYWELIAPVFRDRYHVVAVTARGRGKSDYAPDGSYETEDYVRDFRELTVEMGMEKIVYVGQSLGGKVGMRYAAIYPDQVERLILVDVGGEATPAPIGNPISERPEVFDTLCEAENWLRRYDRFSRLGAEAMKIVLQTSFHRLVNEQWASSIAHALLGPSKPAWEVWDSLPKISCPTLLIHGILSDVLSDEMAKRTRDAIPNCELVEIEAGHLVHLENPNEFIRTVQEFLAH